MSLYTGLTTDIKLAGILALSGYFLLRQTITKEQVQALPNYTTPILMCHGEEDEIVTFHMGYACFRGRSLTPPINSQRIGKRPMNPSRLSVPTPSSRATPIWATASATRSCSTLPTL